VDWHIDDDARNRTIFHVLDLEAYPTAMTKALLTEPGKPGSEGPPEMKSARES
jgi:hypothetical protein